MPAVDSSDPGGLSLAALRQILSLYVNTERALGMDVTIYDPGLDPEGKFCRMLLALLTEVLA